MRLIGLLLACGLLAAQMHVKMPMRDGVRLCANIWRPRGVPRSPVALMRTPYRKPAELSPGLRAFVDHGYTVVVQDVRGRYDSGGVFNPFIQERNDGEDTLDWLARQPWCDGRVGMFGGSYAGLTQWRAALTQHPALKAISPAVSGNDEYLDRFYSPGGAFRLAHRLQWMAENLRPPAYPMPPFDRLVGGLPLRSLDRLATGRIIDFYQEAVDHPFYDDYWRARSTRAQLDRVQAAVFFLSGWYDPFAPSDVEAWRLLRKAKRPARLVLGPWGHNMTQQMPGEDFGDDARPATRAMEIAWFDAYVKEQHAPPPSRLHAFLMGDDAWFDTDAWPPRTTPQSFYLAPGGQLNNRPPVRPAADELYADPRRPVPSRGGALCCNFRLQPWGPADQSFLDGRDDILRYASPPLAAPLRVLGEIKLQVDVSTDAPDTDFAAKLIDVEPDGDARLLADGLLRLRYRQGLERPAPYQPGEVVEITIPVGITGHVFQPGHRVRVDLAGSNFPRFDRNPNTGRDIAGEKELRVAHDRIHLGGRTPSRLVLPVLPARTPLHRRLE